MFRYVRTEKVTQSTAALEIDKSYVTQSHEGMRDRHRRERQEVSAKYKAKRRQLKRTEGIDFEKEAKKLKELEKKEMETLLQGQAREKRSGVRVEVLETHNLKTPCR